KIDRDTASRLGILPQTIDDTLYDAFGQRIVSTIFTQLNQYRVILEVKPGFRESPDALDRLYVKAASGDPVPLSAAAQLEHGAAPLVVSSKGQSPSVTLSSILQPGASFGAAADAIHKAGRAIGLPDGVHAAFAGPAAAFQQSLASEPILILAALVT